MNVKLPLSIAFGINDEFLEDFEIRFRERVAFLNEIGYNGVELGILRPEDVPISQMNEILEEFQMRVVALGTGSTYVRLGYSICSLNEELRYNAIRRVEEYCKLANELEFKPKIVLGLIRGRRPYNQKIESEISLFKESIQKLDNMGSRYGIQMIIEPINQFEVDLLHTLQEVVEILKDLNLNNTYTMVDSFHVWLEEGRDAFFSQLEDYSSYIHHVHLAGPDRRAPKKGGIDYKRIIETLLNKKYNGFFSIEAISKPSFEHLAKQSIEYLRTLL